MNLSELSPDDTAIIKGLPESTHARKSLLAAGLLVGRRITVKRNNSLQGLLLLALDNRSVAIRRRDSAGISVEKIK